MSPVLIVIALFGCKPSDTDDECTSRTFYADADQDGFGDPNGAVEACDAPAGSVENADDCDDHNEERTVVQDWFSDGDHDGYGDPESGPITSCDPILDGVLDGSDCDDDDAAVNPAGTEACGGEDEDCDGLVDDGDPSVDLAAGQSFWADSDGDGLGDAAAPVLACAQPPGTSTNDLDCDDADAAVLGRVEMFPDVDGDAYGDDASGVSSCDPIDGFITSGGDCDDGDRDVNPLAVERCGDGIDNDCDGEVACYEGEMALDEAHAILGSAETGFGTLMAAAGDVNGDGYADLYAASTNAYLFLGPLEGAVDSSSAVAKFIGTFFALASACDQNGDSAPDLIAGYSQYSSVAGVAWLVTDTSAGSHDITSGIQLAGEAAGDRAGSAVGCAGDVDGDGNDDLYVAASSENTAAPYAGAVYLVHGPVLASASLADADTKLTGEGDYNEAGRAVAAVGDVDGDGLADLVVGAPSFSYDTSTVGSERAYLILGPAAASESLFDAAEAVIDGEKASDEFGDGAVGLGDVDADGYADFAVAGPDAGTYGRVYLFHGPVTGSVMATTAVGRFDGDSAGSDFGMEMANVGDVDGDGGRDLLVGAYLWGSSDSGRAYLFDATTSGTVAVADATAIFAAGSDDRAGKQVGALGDVNADGFPDMAISAAGYASGDDYVYVWLGGEP